jgi:hypothetical protein
MLPDYPHKIFNDKRICYCMLMETLSMDTIDSLHSSLLRDAIGL